jgi:hypothetical protein
MLQRRIGDFNMAGEAVSMLRQACPVGSSNIA